MAPPAIISVSPPTRTNLWSASVKSDRTTAKIPPLYWHPSLCTVGSSLQRCEAYLHAGYLFQLAAIIACLLPLLTAISQASCNHSRYLLLIRSTPEDQPCHSDSTHTKCIHAWGRTWLVSGQLSCSDPCSQVSKCPYWGK